MALSLITQLAHEQDSARRAENEQHARHATGVAYAGTLWSIAYHPFAKTVVLQLEQTRYAQSPRLN
jgi:hypothetical protein